MISVGDVLTSTLLASIIGYTVQFVRERRVAKRAAVLAPAQKDSIIAEAQRVSVASVLAIVAEREGDIDRLRKRIREVEDIEGHLRNRVARLEDQLAEARRINIDKDDRNAQLERQLERMTEALMAAQEEIKRLGRVQQGLDSPDAVT